MIELRVLTPDDWREWRGLRLHALDQAREAFSSTLADWQGAGDTEERWRGRLQWAPLNLVASVDGQPAGMASGVLVGSEAELISMWVEQFARGGGTADALIDAVAGWARGQGAARLTLKVVETNHRARSAYHRNGFTEIGSAVIDDDGGPPELPMARPL